MSAEPQRQLRSTDLAAVPGKRSSTAKELLSQISRRGIGSSNESAGIVPEPLFLRLLCLERKRAERSRRPFVLMLLGQEAGVSNGGGDIGLERAASVLLSSVRETDILGWYKERAALGVIFAELGTSPKATALDALRTRITGALRSRFSARELQHTHIAFHWFPEEWEEQTTGRATIATLYPDLARRDDARRISLAVKRALDIAGSLTGLMFLSPVLLTIAAAVKLSSPGPVIFRQQRLGRHGVPFTFLKFRSMNSASDANPHREYVKRFINGHADPHTEAATETVVYKITADPRVTRVGQFLRKTSLDELPQLFNVLTGDMSLVGPRPPIPYEAEAYDVWHRRRFMEVKPGITGLWQVKGRSRVRFDDMVRLDVRYAQSWSLWLDVKILLQTPRAIFTGAY